MPSAKIEIRNSFISAPFSADERQRLKAEAVRRNVTVRELLQEFARSLPEVKKSGK